MSLSSNASSPVHMPQRKLGIAEVEEAVQDASQRMTEALQPSHDSVQCIGQLGGVGRFVV